ncbi:MAG: twin transmembrane helix small protein [Pseudomonadota bacterium]
MSQDPFFLLVVVAVLAVLVVLVLGITNFAKNGEKGGARSNRLMRYRIGAQFVAVVLIAIYVYTKF